MVSIVSQGVLKPLNSGRQLCAWKAQKDYTTVDFTKLEDQFTEIAVFGYEKTLSSASDVQNF
ncbi:MAG: hypothetical protein Q7R45_05450 [Sulfuricaulis sp.]|nr:hypothetical protein [Sulfuricaulis sp.]